MSFVKELLEGGDGYVAKMTVGGASFRPAGATDAELYAFQEIVALLENHDGEGYDIHIKHVSGDHGNGLVDLVMIALAGEDD